jgi:hypothetical protein
MFKGYYRRRFKEILGKPLIPADGLGEGKVAKAVRKRRIVIPRALADYYVTAGKHEVNTAHNRLLPIEVLEWRGDRLVFMVENQQVAFWGIHQAALNESNPVVWQATNVEREHLEWYEEPYLLNQFLMATWRWQKTGLEEKAERRRIHFRHLGRAAASTASAPA